jgi:hypothetical protein
MSNYARIAHALKRPGIDIIPRNTPVLDIDGGGPGIHARVMITSRAPTLLLGSEREILALAILAIAGHLLYARELTPSRVISCPIR